MKQLGETPAECATGQISPADTALTRPRPRFVPGRAGLLLAYRPGPLTSCERWPLRSRHPGL